MAFPIMFNTFDPSALVFSDMKRNTSGGKTIYLRRAANTAALFELPVMRAPFGLSSYTDTKTNKTSYSIDLSMDVPEVAEFFSKVESAVLNHVVSHSEEFLGKTFSREVAESALFKSAIRHGKEPGKYPPTLKLKVLTDRDGGFVPKAYDSSKEPIGLDEIQKGQKVRTIVDINQVWIVDNKFGVTVRLSQIMAFPVNTLPDCAFSDEPTEEDVEE
jgi:hypothetical protein